MPISARQAEGLIRLSEAYAKLRLSNEVTRDDAKSAINLLHSCLKTVASDSFGNIDIDKIAGNFSHESRGYLNKIKSIIADIQHEQNGIAGIGFIVDKSVREGVPEDKANEAIKILKSKGEIYESRRGFVSIIK